MRRYTVTALTEEIDRVVRRHWPSIEVEGEVSQLGTPASGNAYLTLRDRDATLNCVVWRDTWRQQRYRPEVGERVVCRGRLGLYPAQGRYQLYVHLLEPAGQGELQRRLAAIKARLADDGLLDPRRRRPLPRFPRVIGLATSPTGAALQDFLRVSRHRWPAARILLAGCTVQGNEAAASVVRALELLFEDGRADVIVVTRGGGSKLDLLPFHDEQLARWIATAPVPVVSAVGHEIDTSIADLVADAVAPTPSAAAVTVLPDGAALAQRVDEAAAALEGAVSRRLRQQRERVTDLRRRLRHPRQRMVEARRRLDDLRERLLAASARQVRRRRERLAATHRQLQALSPLSVLDRGYAIVDGPHGVVRAPEEVREGDPLTIRLAGGELPAVVRSSAGDAVD